MSFNETKCERTFIRFWEDEKNTPRHFQDGSNAWHTSQEDFLEFCKQCWKIYEIDGTALLYLEKRGNAICIHFSKLRGEMPDDLVNDLIAIRNETFKKFPLIFGYCGSRNRGLKKILEACGFRYYGFNMIFGQTHGKVMEWQCYSMNRGELFVMQNRESLLLSV